MADKKQQENEQQVSVNINLDTTPILYTDSIFITANNEGIVFDVMQRVGNTPQARIVSRVGMSREHARKFAEELSKLLAITQGHAKTND